MWAWRGAPATGPAPAPARFGSRVGAALALGIAFAMDLWSWRSIDPELSAQGAMISAFLAQQGLLVAIALLMALYLGLRNARGLITRPASITVDVIVLFLLYSCAQGAIAASVTRLFP